MNGINLPSLSERQQVAAIIAGAGAVIFALWFFLIMPLNVRRHRLERVIESRRADLELRGGLVEEDVLQTWKQEELRNAAALRSEWLATAARVSIFSNQFATASEAPEHVIDFKVALFDVRQNLLKKSKDLGISLPQDLWLDDTVRSNEDVRRLMLQLRAVEKLVEMALDLKINVIHGIVPRAPIVHTLQKTGEAFAEEYPVEISFSGTSADFFAFLKSSLAPEHVFLLKNIRICAVSPPRPDAINAQLVLSALFFLKDPESVSIPSGPVMVKPTGY